MSFFNFLQFMKGGRLNLFIKYLKPYRREAILLSLISLFSAIFSALSPYAAGNIIDGLIRDERNLYGFTLPLASAFFFFFVWLGTQIFTNIFDGYLSFKSRYMDEEIFADYYMRSISHLIALPLSFHKEKKMGDVQNRLQNAGANLSTLFQVGITLAPQFLSILFALAVTILIKPLLAMLLIISMGIYLVILLKAGPHYGKLLRKMRRAYNEAFGDIHDTLVNVQSVKQAGAENYERKRIYRGLHLKALKFWGDLQIIWQVMNSSQRVLVTLTQSSIYLISIYLITRGEMSIGQLVMFNGYVALFLGPFVLLATNWHAVQNGLVSLERAEKILTEKGEPYNSLESVILPDIKGKIEFKSINFSYGKKHQKVLKNVSFRVEVGEVAALVGESGVGKTTLVDLISRYFKPTGGKVFIDEHDIQTLNLQFLRSKIAVVPQEILLFNETIKNNIRYGNFNASDKKIEEAAHAAYAHEFIERFPKKYRQIVGERGIKLSVGQKQRIAIARAILRDPRILILDEPTSALDAKSEKFVEDALRELMRGRTTFIIAHRLSTVRHADKIIVLERGEIVEEGRHEDLIKIDAGVYQKLYNLQIGLRI